jgi:hypothetical protein
MLNVMIMMDAVGVTTARETTLNACDTFPCLLHTVLTGPQRCSRPPGASQALPRWLPSRAHRVHCERTVIDKQLLGA